MFRKNSNKPQNFQQSKAREIKVAKGRVKKENKLEFSKFFGSGRIINIEALKRGKLHVNLRTFIRHNSISKTDEKRG